MNRNCSPLVIAAILGERAWRTMDSRRPGTAAQALALLDEVHQGVDFGITSTTVWLIAEHSESREVPIENERLKRRALFDLVTKAFWPALRRSGRSRVWSLLEGLSEQPSLADERLLIEWRANVVVAWTKRYDIPLSVSAASLSLGSKRAL